MRGVGKMNYIEYSMEVKNEYTINNFFGSKFYTDELALEVMKDEVMTSNHKLENFFLNHKKELLSYKIKDLKKIFKDCSVRILHLIKTDKRKLIISRNHIEYLDYENNDNSYYDMDSSYDTAITDLNRYILEVDTYGITNSKIKKLNKNTHKILEDDLIFHTYVEDLNKDLDGIYIIINGRKKYIYDFKRSIYE